MHIAFMTFSTPTWTLQEILAGAIRYGYDGVEPRTVVQHKHGIELELTKAQRADVRAAFADCGIKMSAVATSLSYATPDQARIDERVEETKRYLQLAADLGSPNIRVFGGQPPEGMDMEAAVEAVAGALARCAKTAADCNVNIALETHDAFSLGKHAGAVVAQVNQPRVGINWDMAHSVRHGETVAETYELIKGRIFHSHVHDITWPEDNIHDLTMVQMGTGMVDHREAIRLMAQESADIALSLEWESGEAAEEILPREGALLRQFLAEVGPS
jgi:sugar phosphate isomerase/epimerase